MMPITDSSESDSDDTDDSSYGFTSNLLSYLLLLCCCVGSTVIFVAIGYTIAPGKPCEAHAGDEEPGTLFFSRKKSQQSSTINDSTFSAVYAQDGNLTTCSHTDYYSDLNKDTTPWWQIDLLDQYVIKGVKLHARTDCCWANNRDLQLRVGNHEESELGVVFSLNGVCAEFPGSDYPLGLIFNFRCPPMLIGRYVSIQKVTFCPDCTEDALSICKLEFDAHPVRN